MSAQPFIDSDFGLPPLHRSESVGAEHEIESVEYQSPLVWLAYGVCFVGAIALSAVFAGRFL